MLHNIINCLINLFLILQLVQDQILAFIHCFLKNRAKGFGANSSNRRTEQILDIISHLERPLI